MSSIADGSSDVMQGELKVEEEDERAFARSALSRTWAGRVAESDRARCGRRSRERCALNRTGLMPLKRAVLMPEATVADFGSAPTEARFQSQQEIVVGHPGEPRRTDSSGLPTSCV